MPAVIGTVEQVSASGGALLFDRAGSLTVSLAQDGMMLTDADETALDRGANLALVGDELLQFAAAEPLGANRWRLSRLSRGRRGTEAAAGTQSAGDRFVLLTADGVRTIDLPIARLGAGVRVMATGVGDGDGVVAAMTVTGRSVLPPSPVHLAASMHADGGAIVGWVRRSRGGWRWIDGADAAIAEESEAYRITLTDVDGVTRTIDTDRPMLALTADDLGPRPVVVCVRQRGTFGLSDPAALTLA